MSFLAVACKQFSGTFTFSGSGAVMHFVIASSVKHVTTASIKFKAAERLAYI